jgi:tryptophan 2,3-dioxygenase
MDVLAWPLLLLALGVFFVVFFRRPHADANWWLFSPDPDDPNISGNRILSSKLKGLREVNPPKGKRLLLDYHSYIGLDRLLTSQVPSSIVPDERAFIITHQLCELIFKLMIFDLSVVADTLQRLLNIEQDKEFHAECEATEGKATASIFWRPALTASARIEYSSEILLPAVIGYLTKKETQKETFNSGEFKKFIDYLKPSSGFQTAQFRLIQKALGKTNLLGIRLFPSQEYREKYEGKKGEEPLRVIDRVILRGDSKVASPETGSPLTDAATVDEYAHQTLARLHRAANAGGPEFHRPIRYILPDDIEEAVKSDPTIDTKARSTFRADLEKAVKTENERRAGLTDARKGAFYLHSVAPHGNLARVLDRLVSADLALHDSKKKSFLSLHRGLATQRRADVKRLAEEAGEPEPSPGTGGGGPPYLKHVLNSLMRHFPALVAYYDLRDLPTLSRVE